MGRAKGEGADVLTVETRREDLEKAQADRDANAVTDAEISYAKGDLAAAKTELSQLELMLSELNDALADDPALQEAQAAVTEWTQKVSTAQTAVDTYQQQLDELESGGSVDLDRQIADAKTALEKAKNTWRSDWLAYKSDLGALIEAVRNDGYSVTSINTGTDTPQEISGNNQVYIEAYLTQYVTTPPTTGGGTGEEGGTTRTAVPASDPSEGDLQDYQTAYDALLSAQNDVASKQTAYDRLVADQDIASGSASEQRRAIQSKLDDAESELRSAQRELRDAEDTLEDAEADNADLKAQINLYGAAQREQTARLTTLPDNVTYMQEKKTAQDAPVDTIADQEQARRNTRTGADMDCQL